VPPPGSAAASSSATSRPTPVVDTSPYPWHADTSIEALTAVEHLEDRFAPPAGFSRVSLKSDSFGAWLRRLPLAAPSTPVVTYRGDVLHPAGHPYIAAVTTLDVGKADLQQCADAVMRLHAEWLWSRGKRDMNYRSAGGQPISYARWSSGMRLVLRDKRLQWVPAGRPSGGHASFRKYLDTVFSWANTVALSRQAKKVDVADLRPGDFMILGGNPGHTVLVLDMAQASDGRRVALLGQSYMPAQSFQVLRPGPKGLWFTIDPASGGVPTPFWPEPFPWSSLRRLD